MKKLIVLLLLLCGGAAAFAQTTASENQKRRTYGWDYSDANMFIGGNREAGSYESGVLFNIKRPSLLEAVTLTVCSIKSDKDIEYRINIYRQVDDKTFELLETDEISGKLQPVSQLSFINIPVKSNDIVLEGKILVAFEHIREGKDEDMMLPTGFTGPSSYYRNAGETQWSNDLTRFPLSISVIEIQ